MMTEVRVLKVGILHRHDWPKSYLALWEAGIRPPLLPGDPSGAGATWRSQTINTTAASLGRWIFFLREQDGFDEGASPEQLVTPDRLRAYLEHLAGHNRPATVLHRIIGLERGLAVLAPGSDRSLLRLIISNLEKDYDAVSKRERLQEAAALVELGFALRQRGVAKGIGRLRNSTLFRDGLQISLLAMRPLRLKNFSAIRIGRQLIPHGTSWAFDFKGHEMKNHRPIDPIFPEKLVGPMKDYIEIHRRIIVDGRYDGDALWVSSRSQPQSAITIRHQLCKWTKEAFGLPITPHLFRDCAATSLAVHSPEEVQIAHLILGNTYAVMQKHYNLARVVEAACTYHGALERLCTSLAVE